MAFSSGWFDNDYLAVHLFACVCLCVSGCFGSLAGVYRQPLTEHGRAFLVHGPNQLGNSRLADVNRGQRRLACSFHAQLTLVVFSGGFSASDRVCRENLV